MAVSLLILVLVLVGAGVALLIAGVRGRRVDDHPICRRCGFDLVGLPQGAAVGSGCGADLSAPRAIIVGHRVRRSGLRLAGAALLIVSAGAIGLAAWSTATRFDVN